MARIILGTYMVRYPLGGVLSSSLQWLIGLKQLGHDVYVVEKSGWANSCFDPIKKRTSDDCSYGVTVVSNLLSRFDLQDKWCFVDARGNYYGLTRQRVRDIFKSADLFIDRGSFGTWLGEAADTKIRVLFDGEPGFNQMKMEKKLSLGREIQKYDYYATVGRNIGTLRSSAPTAAKCWLHMFHPVVVDLFPYSRPDPMAPFTTVMNWQSHAPIQFGDVTYGQKDVEFDKFLPLPRYTSQKLEVAVSGGKLAEDRLLCHGWHVRAAQDVTLSFDSYVQYIRESKGEFSVCKNVFVATHSGWFSDRSAVYLANSRPVVLQDTGFSEHLPSGRGLFAVHTVREATAAIQEINCRYEDHANWAHEIAVEYLNAKKVLRKLLDEIGL
jgi:hypothetical protein